MSSITQWALVSGVKGIIADSEKDGKVQALVNTTESAISGFFPGDEKVIKQMIVQKIIFPFCKLLLKDDIEGFKKAKETL